MAFKHHTSFIDPPMMMPFACFDCRKAFKRKLSLLQQRNQPPICPECGGEMWEMGRQFKAPKHDDVKQWRKVESLVSNGITFHSQRLSQLCNLPKVLREVVPFVRRVRNRQQSEGERLLDVFPRRRKRH